VLVVRILEEGDSRFSHPLREVQGISQKLLTQSLRGLERDGLVSGTVYPEVPVRVEYALTSAGRTLLDPLRAIRAWSIEHMGYVAASQDEYDHSR
jgi:DNA-binding HxlR family transcriptional regulator